MTQRTAFCRVVLRQAVPASAPRGRGGPGGEGGISEYAMEGSEASDTPAQAQGSNAGGSAADAADVDALLLQDVLVQPLVVLPRVAARATASTAATNRGSAGVGIPEISASEAHTPAVEFSVSVSAGGMRESGAPESCWDAYTADSICASAATEMNTMKAMETAYLQLRGMSRANKGVSGMRERES